jgi:hypothetical protein
MRESSVNPIYELLDALGGWNDWRPNGTRIGGCCVKLHSFQNLNETFETLNIRNWK